MTRNVRKSTFSHVCPAKIQTSLLICAVWSDFFLGTFNLAKDAKCLHADNEDWSDCEAVQSDKSLRWEHMSEGTFTHKQAQMFLLVLIQTKIQTKAGIINRMID